MTIKQRLRAQLKEALRQRDLQTANTIRMIETRVTERKTAKGFSGEVNDALYEEVIAAYKKSLEKAIKEFEAVGQRGQEPIAALKLEVALCATYLPEPLAADAVREAVQAAIAELGAVDPKMAGRVIGVVMRAHKGLVEAAQVKQIVAQELDKPT